MFQVYQGLPDLVEAAQTQAEFNQVRTMLVTYKDRLNKAIVDFDNRVEVLSQKVEAGLLGKNTKLEVVRIHAKRGKEASAKVEPDKASIFMPTK